MGRGGSSAVTTGLQKFAAALVMLVMLALAVGVVWSISTGSIPEPKDPSFIDVLFQSRAMIASARVAMLFLAAYVVVSVIALISRGQWLSSVGPIKASEAVRDATEEVEQLQAQLLAAEQTIEELSRQMTNALGALDVAKRDRDEVIREHGKLERALREREAE